MDRLTVGTKCGAVCLVSVIWYQFAWITDSCRVHQCIFSFNYVLAAHRSARKDHATTKTWFLWSNFYLRWPWIFYMKIFSVHLFIRPNKHVNWCQPHCSQSTCVHEKVVTDGQTNGQPEIKCLPSLADWHSAWKWTIITIITNMNTGRRIFEITSYDDIINRQI